MKTSNDLNQDFTPVLLAKEHILKLGRVKVYRIPLPSSTGFVLIVQYLTLADEVDEYSSKEQATICKTESEATLVAAKIIEDFVNGKSIL